MKKQNTWLSIIVLLLAIAVIVFGNLYRKHKHTVREPSTKVTAFPPRPLPANGNPNDIRALTGETTVIAFLKAHHKLPDYYITKKEARRHGWNAASGNLCDVLPGRAIGGDIFSNREHALPSKKGRVWQEADVNYNCGTRNADRLLYSSDGLIFITEDHYKTFQQR